MATEWLPIARTALALGAASGLSAASGALNAPPWSRRAAAFSIVALSLFTPFLASPTTPALRFLCACSGALAFFRNLELARDARPWKPAGRVVHVLLPFDSRSVVPSPRGFDTSSCVRAAAFTMPTVLCIAFLLQIGTPTTPATWLARWAVAAMAAYCSIEVVMAVQHTGARLLGFTLPKLHDNPIFARTLAEFWGRRWNLGVRNMLHEHCFRPLARRTSLTQAVLATFAASALLHAWLLLAAGGFALALSIASFFLIQGGFALVEQRAQVRRWPAMFQRTWTACAVLLPLPLLLEPLLALTLP
jgi:hypothetical protein